MADGRHNAMHAPPQAAPHAPPLHRLRRQAARREIPANERCIVALDVATREEAAALTDELDGVGVFYKIGLELFAAGVGKPLMDDLTRRGLQVFADLKLFDVPRTVARATARLADGGAHYVTVHGNDAMLEAAARAKGENMRVLAVTALTSLDDGDLRDLGFKCDVAALVLSRAKRALALGCDGVVSSGLEIAALRAGVGDELILVTPGVRPVANKDDQKRTATPAEIIQQGGDYLVVGRPITEAKDRRAAFLKIVAEISAAAA